MKDRTALLNKFVEDVDKALVELVENWPGDIDDIYQEFMNRWKTDWVYWLADAIDKNLDRKEAGQ